MVEGILASFDMGAVNLAVCVLDMETKKVHHWFIIDIFRAESLATGAEVKSGDCNIDKHIEALVPALDEYYDIFKPITHVAIEQQPSGRGAFANNKMNNLQHALKVWFMTRFGICARIVSPKHKLKIIRSALKEDDALCDPVPITPKAAKTATKKEKARVARQRYQYHKKRAVQCTRKIGGDHATETHMTLFEASKKKDDYGDSFLQGLWFIDELNREVVKKAKNAAALAKKATKKRKSPDP
jgi:hypothetical protein